MRTVDRLVPLWRVNSGALALRLRGPERVLLAYFFYLPVLALVLHNRPRADFRLLGLTAGVSALLFTLAYFQASVHRFGFCIVRDWTSLALVLVAYRALDLFSPKRYQVWLETAWRRMDLVLLDTLHLKLLIESCGRWIPTYLESCYLLTSAAGCFALAIVYLYGRRGRADRFLLVYVMGTLLSYALIPFLRLEPPRTAFPNQDLPQVATVLRSINLAVLSDAGIHSGVFPSAHVSSTFSAAWGLFLALPERKRYGWIFLVYAGSVAVATIYGRYHYSLDVAAGLAVSVIALWASLRWRRRLLPQQPAII